MTKQNDGSKKFKAKKAKKPLTKGAKIGIVAGATVGVILLSAIIAVLVILLKPLPPSGPVDDSAITMQTNEINVGTVGSIGDGDPIVVLSDVLSGKAEYSCDGSKGTIQDMTIGDVTKIVMIVIADSGSFDLTYKSDTKTETIKVNIVDGMNVYTIADFDKSN